MSRLFPYPHASAVLVVTWILLDQSLSASLLLGIALAIVGPLFLHKLDVPHARLRRPLAIVRLSAVFVVDMVRSNINVARVILHGNPDRTNGFVDIPLRLRSPYALSILACLITAAPGTCWVTHNPETGLLTIHVLDLSDDDDWAAIIKRRYEGLLMEIFE